MFNLDKQLVLKGIGKGFFQTVTDKITEVTYGQNLKFDVKATMTDVEGGDGMFPIYTFIAKKEGTIEVDSATFSFAQTSISQTMTIKQANVKRNIRVVLTKSDKSLGDNLTGVSDVKCISPQGTIVPLAATAEAVGTDKVFVAATGGVTYGTSLEAGEYTFWAKVDATDAAEAILLKDAMPEVASFTWMITTEDLEGNKYQIDIYAKRVRADGGLTFDTSRDKANVSKLTVKILDPGNGSEDFAKITISKIA